MPSIGNRDIFVAKYDGCGQIQWVVRGGSSGDQDVVGYGNQGITSDVSGNIYIVGRYNQAFTFYGTNSTTFSSPWTATSNGNHQDGFLVKLNSNGQVLWGGSLRGSSNDGYNGVEVDNSGNVVVTGGFNGCCPSSFAVTIFGPNGSLGVNSFGSNYGTGIIVKYDTNGNILWKAAVYNRDTDLNSLAIDGSNNIYLTSSFRSWSNGTAAQFIDASGSNNSLFNPGIGLGFLVKLNASGNWQWGSSFGNVGDGVGSLTSGSDVDLDESGNPWVVGYFRGQQATIYSTNGANLTMPASTNDIGFLISYNSSGVAQSFVTRQQSTGNTNFRSLAIANNKIAVAGYYTGANAGQRDILLANYSTTGAFLDAQVAGGSGEDYALSIIPTDNSFAVCGSTAGGFTLDGVSIASPCSYLWNLGGGQVQSSVSWSTGENSPSINVSPTTTTTYTATFSNGTNSCSQEVIVNVAQPSASTINTSINQGESYSFNGQILTSAGTYTATLQNAAGCDSVVTLNLVVEPIPLACSVSSLNNAICNGESETLEIQTNPALQFSDNRLLVAEYNLTFEGPFNYSLATEIGEEYEIEMSGVWAVHCDNIGQMDAAYAFNQGPALVNPQFMAWNGASIRPTNDVYNASHNYVYSNLIASQVSQNFVFIDNPYGDNCGSLNMKIYKISNQLQGTILWSTGETTPTISVSPTETTTYNVTVSQGTQTCTSDVTITVNQPSATTETVSACGSYTWKGNTYTQSGTYTWTGTNAAGCDSVVTLSLTITPQPVQPPKACYETATFNPQTCSWVLTGTQPVQPPKACYQTATFNTQSCSWDVTGTQPVQPATACYQTATFNTQSCSWDVTGTQSVQPATACYQTVTFNTQSCSWDVTGTQPVQPATACYQTATFNTQSCSWDVTGTQPVQPATACYQTATFNTQSCSWDVTGTQPVQPPMACYQTATFNTQSCSWDVTGSQPIQPPTACYQTATFNTQSCSWDVTGTQPVQPATACYQTATFNTQSCSWDVTGSPAPSIATTASACGSYTWSVNGQSYTSSGNYTYSENCQEYALNLTINQATTSTINATINQGESYSFNGQNLTIAGTFTATLQNSTGCDSVVTLNLTVNSNFDCATLSVINSDTSICLGSTVQLSTPVFVTPNSNIILAPGSNFEYAFAPVEETWNTSMGAWSSGNAPFGNVSGGVDGNNDFNYNTYWPADGADGDDLFLRKIINLSGYDLSDVIYNLGVDNGFKLYINGNLVASENAEGFTTRWEYSGQVPAAFLNNGVNILAIALEDHGGLTAFDMQLIGEVLPSYNSTLWSTGETTPSISVSPTETTTYSVTVTQGTQTCTSDLTITVNQPTSSTINASITDGETYSFNGQNLTTAGTYTATLQNAAGCDSVLTLNLTVNPVIVAGCYAATVVDFVQGLNSTGGAIPSIRSNATQALGQPEAVVTNVVNFVTLGFGGTITVAFETPIANGAGNDIRLDETTWGNYPCSRNPEKADVFASQDGTNFIYLGQACQDASFDLGTLSWAKYIRLVDVSNSTLFNGDGYDLNGIECLNGSATNPSNDGLQACTLQEIVSYAPGNRKNGTAVPSPRNDANSALGEPQSNNTINFVALGFGGTLIAKFDYVVFNQPGNDLRVTETSFGNPSCTNYPEKARVSLSLDNQNWIELGEICQDGTIEMGTMPYAQYIRIQDASPMSSSNFNKSADGYDVDAVVVLNNGCGAAAARLADADNTTTPNEDSGISVFPNPMQEFTTIRFDNLSEDSEFTLELFDGAGRLIQTQKIEVSADMPEFTMKASDLAHGIYQVVIHNETTRFMQRLVK